MSVMYAVEQADDDERPPRAWVSNLRETWTYALKGDEYESVMMGSPKTKSHSPRWWQNDVC